MHTPNHAPAPSRAPALLAAAALLVSLLTAAAVLAPPARAGEEPPAAHGEPTIAVVALVTLADELMNTDRFAPERDEFIEEIRAELLEPIADQLRELEEDIRASDPDDPDVQNKQRQYFQLQQRLGQARQQVEMRREALAARQLREAFELIRSSAVGVAGELGYPYVLATERPADDLTEGAVPMSVTRTEVLSRTVLRFPETADITDRVREDLNLD